MLLLEHLWSPRCTFFLLWLTMRELSLLFIFFMMKVTRCAFIFLCCFDALPKLLYNLILSLHTLTHITSLPLLLPSTITLHIYLAHPLSTRLQHQHRQISHGTIQICETNADELLRSPDWRVGISCESQCSMGRYLFIAWNLQSNAHMWVPNRSPALHMLIFFLWLLVNGVNLHEYEALGSNKAIAKENSATRLVDSEILVCLYLR